MNLKQVVYLLAALSAATLTQAQVLTEDFSNLTPGTPITTQNTIFTMVRTLGNPEAVEAVASTMGSGRSMLLRSSASNTAANYVGVGVDGLSASKIFSLSLDLKSENWRTNHGLTIGMGNSTDTDGFYSSTGNITGATAASIYEESLFAVRLFGNSNVGSNPNSAKLQTVGSGSWIDQDANVISNKSAVNFHFVVNGGDVALNVGDITLISRSIGIWLNGEFLSSYAIAASETADSLRIFTQGRGGQHTTSLEVEVGAIRVWDEAVSPIPESSTYAMIFSGIASVSLLLFRRRR